MKRRFAEGFHETFSSLRVRNFRLFFIGQGISQVGNWLTLLTQTLLVLKLTGSGVAVGLLAAAQFGPVLILGAWAGLVADRSNKRRLLITVQVFAMLQSFALAGLAFMKHPPVPAFYVVAFLGGITLAFDNPARRSFVVEMVDADQVNNAVSLNSAVMTSSRIVGPMVAGLLIHSVGYGWCFFADACSYVAVLVGYGLMRTDELRPATLTARGKGQVREGLRYARSTPELWVPLVMMTVIGTLTFNFQVVLPLLVKRTFHAGDIGFTALFSVLSVGAFVGALASARRKDITVDHVVRAAALFGIAMVVFSAVPWFAAAFPVGLVVGVASITFLTTTTTIVQVRAAPEMRGRVLALQAMVFLGSTPIGGPILGALCDWVSPRAGVLVGGLAALGAAAWGRHASQAPREQGAGDGTRTSPFALRHVMGSGS